MTKKEISQILGIDQNTIKNWERTRPKLHNIVIEYFSKENQIKDYNDIDFLKSEMIKAIDKLPDAKTKKFYHLMMAELSELGY
ncbi:MAG: Unknown protein [uncultured Campylobacterales bacterium]|uniref:Uncharacterized protein n=1 Tax=uncultured Campylobacterales bacterium TaxID=352960 RepID=A0A6S6T7W7_9BACT|nr:MAG: Unknown protein [uncultured Campylobacterales bacterium]